MDSIAVILLAAGSSRRMGEKNKLLLPYRGQPMICHQVEQIISAGMREQLIVVLGHQAAVVKSAVPEGITTIFNPYHAQGMTSSIQAGIQAVPSNASGYMICLSDMPRLITKDYQKISQFFLAQYQNDPAVIIQPVFYQLSEDSSVAKKKTGHPVVFSKFYKNELLAHKAPEGCRNIIRTYREQVKQVEMESAILWDVDTAEDWLKA